jgi:hypothetical protein
MKRSQRLRPKIHALVQETGFTNTNKLPTVELTLVRAIELIDSYQKPASPAIHAVGRPNLTAYRTILTGAIFRAWRIGMGKKAKINKRLPGAQPNAFVAFATEIYRLLHIHNVIDNLDAYRTLGNTMERNGWVAPLAAK